jgi:hypothetical protein
MAVAGVNSVPAVAMVMRDAQAHARQSRTEHESEPAARPHATQSAASDNVRARRDVFEERAPRAHVEPVSRVQATKSAALLAALIATMGGGPMPSGKGVYIDIRV